MRRHRRGQRSGQFRAGFVPRRRWNCLEAASALVRRSSRPTVWRPSPTRGVRWARKSRDLGARALQPLEVAGCGEPVIGVVQSQLFGLAVRDLAVDPIEGDPPDVPESAGPGSVGVEEVEGTGVAEGELEVEPGCVRLVDRLEVDRQRDVAKPTAGGLGDEGERRSRTIHGDPPGSCTPSRPASRARPSEGVLPAGELEVDGDEPGDAGRPSRGESRIRAPGPADPARLSVGLGRRATTEMVARRGRVLRLPLHRRSDRRSRGLLGDLRGKIERREMVEHAVAAGLVVAVARRRRAAREDSCADRVAGTGVEINVWARLSLRDRLDAVIGTQGFVARTGLGLPGDAGSRRIAPEGAGPGSALGRASRL